MAHAFRSTITAVTALAIVLAPLPLHRARAELTRADYESCQARDEAGLRDAIAAIANDTLRAGMKNVDYRTLVAEQWRKSNLDRVIDARVDIAIDDVKKETSWSERLKSLADTETSQKLATSVAERVYHSDAVKAAIEDLASGVAKDVAKSVEFATTESAGPLLECLKAFVGPRYGSAVSQALTGEAERGVHVDPNQGAGQIGAGAILKETGGGIAGLTVLVVRRQLANLARRVGQRIVGSIMSRLVSVVAGGVGLVLIAKDIWDFRHGVLPIIATEMKSTATKDKVREEIAATLADQMGEHLKAISAATADNVVEIWQGFKRAHALVLQLAEANGAFRSFLDGVKAEALPRLDEVVGLIAGAEGEGAVLRRLADGSLNAAVHTLPDKGMEIARDTKSIAAGLDWATLAGPKLDAVVEHEIHRRAKPADFTRAALERVLALGDRAAIVRLAGVPAAARDALFSLATPELNQLVKSLSEAELTTLASYLNGLQQAPRDLVLRAVSTDPARMQVLASARVRDAIIASADQAAAAEMMLRPSATSASPRQIAGDAVMAWEGRIAPLLLWEKHPVAVAGGGVLALLLVLWLGRLFRRPTRPQPPPAANNAATGAGPATSA